REIRNTSHSTRPRLVFRISRDLNPREARPRRTVAEQPLLQLSSPRECCRYSRRTSQQSSVRLCASAALWFTWAAAILLDRQLEDLARLDLVGIGQLIFVRVEDLHVGIGVAERFLRNLAQRIAGLHGVGPRPGTGRPDSRGLRLRYDPDVGVDVLLPVG